MFRPRFITGVLFLFIFLIFEFWPETAVVERPPKVQEVVFEALQNEPELLTQTKCFKQESSI